MSLVAEGNNNTSALQPYDGQVLQSSQLLVGHDNQILESTSVTANNSVNISFQRHGSKPGRQVIDIITLPEVYDARDSDIVPTVKMPENGDTSMRMILDRTARSDYTMNDSQNQTRLLIERPLDKIKQTVLLDSALGPLAGPSKKRSRPIYTDPKEYRIPETGDDEQITHAFDLSDQIIADAGSLDARRNAKRLRQVFQDEITLDPLEPVPSLPSQLCPRPCHT